jgi:endonuclease YncB( thermonuclease family)
VRRVLAGMCWSLGLAALTTVAPLQSAHAQGSARARETRTVARPAATQDCRFDATATGRVRAVTDGRSFTLEDGREIRLVGIEVPLPPAAAERGERAESDRVAGEAARAALAALIAEQEVELRLEGVDRYGRLLALVRRGNGEPAQDLVARGYARVAAQVGSLACAAILWERERAAREGKLGLWGEAYYAVRRADDLAGLVAEQGQFAVVEGKVASVRESGGTIYVNFGRRWSQALTITISKRNERILAAAGREPQQLENRQVRVRGWLDERSGPRIEVSRPEQIEIADRR